MKISKIIGRQIIDSRGMPTVEADVILENNIMGRAAVPSGASTGMHEAIELRDGDSAKFLGKGVLKAVENIKIIEKELIGQDASNQALIDEIMIDLDGTHNKAKLGANAILAVSIAAAKAAALNLGLPLFKYLNKANHYDFPMPMMNIINGGAHANNSIDIQEFMVIPKKASCASEAIRIGSEIFQTLKKLLNENNKNTAVGDEGGFAPDLTSNEAIEYILKATERAGYTPGVDVFLALDVAASELYNGGLYNFKGENKVLDIDELIGYYDNLISKYPIISIEDPMHEGDFLGWKKISRELGDKIQIVGDDVFVTNPEKLTAGIKDGIANAILIKPNQIGTLSETIETIKLAQHHNYKTIISHRSGETEDVTIAHIATAFSSGQIKTGSMCRSDRVAKYNELIRIEEIINQK